MNNVIRKIIDNGSGMTSIHDGKYILQVYSGAKQGNITRTNGTVLCRFYIDEEIISFAFAKQNNPMEFGYEKYPISLEADTNAIRNIPHRDAEELYKVLIIFAKNK